VRRFNRFDEKESKTIYKGIMNVPFDYSMMRVLTPIMIKAPYAKKHC
jgi:hypothetical protein